MCQPLLTISEAAYCSLIKGYTLLSLGRPVTLLGDHAQLPPVCEMSERILNRAFCPEFLWAQSTVHLDSVFQNSALEIYEEYRCSSSPCFVNLQLNVLSVTHRFGPQLSSILSDFIYDQGLTSAKSDLILVLDSDYWYIQEQQLIGQLLHIASLTCV